MCQTSLNNESHSKGQIIWQVVASIPYGRVASYGQVAKMAGLPNYARFVGSTLKKLPASSALPWHRVVSAQGRLAFDVNSEAFARQKKRLEAEGICFSKNVLSMLDYGWRP